MIKMDSLTLLYYIMPVNLEQVRKNKSRNGCAKKFTLMTPLCHMTLIMHHMILEYCFVLTEVFISAGSQVSYFVFQLE